MVLSDEMTAVLAAIAPAPALPFLHGITIRVLRGGVLPFKHLLAALFLYVCCWAALTCAFSGGTPLNARHLLAGGAMVGFFCFSYMEFFSMVFRGFSLRILVDVRQKGSLSFEGILREYGGGRGPEWVLRKRLSSMAALGLVRLEDDVVEPSGRTARWIACATSGMKRFLRMGEGG